MTKRTCIGVVGLHAKYYLINLLYNLLSLQKLSHKHTHTHTQIYTRSKKNSEILNVNKA